MAKVALKRIPNICECGNHAWVSLTRWGVTLVSPEDAWLLLERPWQLLTANKTLAYASGNGSELLHRRVMGAAKGQIIDHRNHNGLDNRRSNVRLATSGQNMANLRKKQGTASRYKGVSVARRASGEKWRAFISVNDRSISLGTFDTEVEAAEAYDRAALKHFGSSFCMTNKKLGLIGETAWATRHVAALT